MNHYLSELNKYVKELEKELDVCKDKLAVLTNPTQERLFQLEIRMEELRKMVKELLELSKKPLYTIINNPPNQNIPFIPTIVYPDKPLINPLPEWQPNPFITNPTCYNECGTRAKE